MSHITQELDKAYEAGWVEAACWAKRDDLVADIGSPAYIADREAHLDSIRAALAQSEPVSPKLCCEKFESCKQQCTSKTEWVIEEAKKNGLSELDIYKIEVIGANREIAGLEDVLNRTRAAHEIEVGLLLATINVLTAELKSIKESDENNHCVVMGFTDEGLALVDYPSEGNTISLEEGMILHPLAAAKGGAL